MASRSEATNGRMIKRSVISGGMAVGESDIPRHYLLPAE
jgi:hypothetical protein